MKVRDAILMVEELERRHNVNFEASGYIFMSEFKRYIIETHGSDEKTIRGYLNVLLMFGLVKRDQYDPDILRLTYRDSPDYKAFINSRNRAREFFLGKDEPKNEAKV